jgi:alkanesulfonate monooxygenase SsuD/methylene tetrahydromethanopterin reductase-like flavin-dependent oxidoreductase (luciferase family)
MNAMDVGVGLPNAVKGTSGEELVEFARHADERGFSSLGTIDRVVYGNYEPLVALAAAAAVTERIRLATTVLLAPLRHNAVSLAKQARSLNVLSGGRLTLGVGLGGRGDDYDALGVPTKGRGEKMDELLAGLREAWADVSIGPAGDAPELLVGGHVDASFKRAAKWGDGWIAGGATPEDYAKMVDGVKAAWAEEGRDGEPRLAGLAYYSLGENAEENARAYLTDYYAFLGEEVANMIAASAATDAETVQAYLQAFEGAGCGELILFPCSSDARQADLLADAAGL